jgi:hypothetical protein
MSILDNLASNAENQWLSEKLEDNPEQDEALQTTARVMTAHIWPFLAAAISDDDYRARRGVKEDEVRYVCATVAPHMAATLTDYVLDGFDADYDLLRKTAQEEGLLADELLPALVGSAEDKGDEDDDGDEGLFSNPKVEHLVHQAPGGGVHGPYYIREVGGGYDVVNAQGESKGHHDTKAEAREQQKALYVHIPKAREQAESREGKAPPKAVQEVGEPGSEEQREHEGSLRVANVESPPTPDELAVAMAGHLRDRHDYAVSSDPADLAWMDELHDDDHQHNADFLDHTHRPRQAARRRVAQGDPYSPTTLFPQAKDDNDGDDEEDQGTTTGFRPHTNPNRNRGGPGLFSNPKADWEIESDSGPYSWSSNWGQNQVLQQSRAAAYQQWQMDRAELEQHLRDYHHVPVEQTSYGALRNTHALDHKRAPGQGHTHVSLAKENQFEGRMKAIEAPRPAQQQSSSAQGGGDVFALLGLRGQEEPRSRPRPRRARPQMVTQLYGPPWARNFRQVQVRPKKWYESSAQEHRVGPHWEDRMSDVIVDRYGHIRLGASRLPEYGPQGGYDRSRDPQQDEGPDPFEEYWEDQESRSPERDVHFHHDEPHYEADWEGDYRGGARERNPRISAKEKEEKGTVPCPICHKKFEPDELAEHMKTVHGISEGGEEGEEHKKKAPGAARAGQSKAKPSAGRQTHRPTRGRPKGPAKQGQLVRSSQRPPGARRSPAAPEMGYDPSEAFPGYYGTPEPPRRPRTAQAPLAGNSDVPVDPESSTGASGQFNPGGALNVAMPGGTVDTDFSQADAPQDIQAQLGQLPTLSHKIGAKLAEMATEVLTHNPHLSALAAMEVALKAVRLYPKVAAGGADYLAEPGTEGVPTEVLTDCPQCQRQAYNAEINRCHFCGFYDAGLEPSIEVT